MRGFRATSAYRKSASSERSEEHTSELQSHLNLVCRLLLEKKKQTHALRSNYWLNGPAPLDSCSSTSMGITTFKSASGLREFSCTWLKVFHNKRNVQVRTSS